MFDTQKIRLDFPIFSQKINGKPNVFLDSAASAQKPTAVIEAMKKAYLETYANVHRGSYFLSEESTQKYEEARKTVQHFINSKSEKEIIFTRNATESINLVASTWGKKFLKAEDEILISEAEHHANLVPWQALRDEIGFKLNIFKIANDGSYLEEEFLKLLSPKTKLVAVTAMSNVLGTVFPIQKICEQAHQVGAKILVDACQFAVHHKIDVQDLDCDFLVFSGHKTYGPTGIGVLYGKYNILLEMPPYQFGGDMVDVVTYQNTTYALPPARFEAGTPAIVEAIGLGEALKYMQNLGLENIMEQEKELTSYASKELSEVKGLIQIGTAKNKGGVFSFILEGIHPQDVAFILNKEGISVRVGHHCSYPLVKRMGYESVIRASIGLYSTKEDIDCLIAALLKAKTFF
ncbi:MAG: aminotransferase class V-fold PLP-dependent enzyme [Alphaproteobacteria bacterium]